MSGHLIGCTKPLDLPTSHKLALVAFADSADDRTHIGFPGEVGVQEWASCSRSRAYELIADLVEWGYLKQHKRAHRGRRAEYIVFPDGCCDLHRLPVEEPDVDVEDLARRAGVSVEQALLLLGAMAPTERVVQPPAAAPESTEKGSDAPDPVGGNVSDAPDPNSRDVHEPPPEPVDNAGKGPERVHGSRSTENAFTPSENKTPLPPPASRQGRCPVHPTPVPDRRCCGTTARQLAKAAETQAAEERRTAAALDDAERRAREAQAIANRDPARTAAALAEAKQAIARTREAS